MAGGELATPLPAPLTSCAPAGGCGGAAAAAAEAVAAEAVAAEAVAAAGVPPPAVRITAALRELARERPLSLTVRGDCMAPRLRDGDRVEIAPARWYWPGDIVALPVGEGSFAVHRLLGYRLLGGRLASVTRGDACASADSPLPMGRLLGRAAVRPGPSLGERLRAVAAFGRLAAAAVACRWRP